MTDNLNFSNTNSLWGSFLVEGLFRAGVRQAVVSPGARSAPLTYALALHPGIRAVPVVDERSASFFALGMAKRSGGPVALVCTSGTAAANFYPAVIEARESGVPLLVLTADRPPELRECRSGQTIDQVKIFGGYPRWQAELSIPEASEKLLAYLRQVLCYACERTLWPAPGPVHLNVPFRDPLAPVPDESLAGVDRGRVASLLDGMRPPAPPERRPAPEEARHLAEAIGQAARPLVVAGPCEPADRLRYVQAVRRLAAACRAPVLADALSPVRQGGAANEFLIGHYDALLARQAVPAEVPDLVVRLGQLPTSKRLRKWLEQLDCPQWVVEEGDQNVDPLHSRCRHLRAGVAELVEEMLPGPGPSGSAAVFAEGWTAANAKASREIDQVMSSQEALFEGKIPWLLGRHAPAGAALFFSNSTPVRDAEAFWPSREEAVDLFFNRGANGIDGIVSTAMGLAAEGGETFLVTGDLAFLHDQNGLLNAGEVRGGLTIVLINNGGGGIFRALPVAEFDPPFREFFLTPQKIDFATLCAAHQISHQRIADWATFVAAIGKPWRNGLRVLEVPTDSAADWRLRARLLGGMES